LKANKFWDWVRLSGIEYYIDNIFEIGMGQHHDAVYKFADFYGFEKAREKLATL